MVRETKKDDDDENLLLYVGYIKSSVYMCVVGVGVSVCVLY